MCEIIESNSFRLNNRTIVHTQWNQMHLCLQTFVITNRDLRESNLNEHACVNSSNSILLIIVSDVL